ncbi:MAG: hypothetical protein OEV92_12725 [Nitrospinota bacterium]|nr:hypothetical protein [Nitrospinota bacterium]
MNSSRVTLAVFAAALVVFISASSALAMPHFSRKYAVPCATCHSAWPKLTDTGVQFKFNGYQLPDGQDGEEASKLPLNDSLFMDIGPANPPASVILHGGATLIQPNHGYAGKQEGKFFCCVEGSEVNLEVAGSAAANIAYRLSLPWGSENIAQGYLRFVNLFSPGFLGLDVGLMDVVDNDVVSDRDSWFAFPLASYWGSPTHPLSSPVGMGAHISDTGGRVYGRPGYGMFSYELGVFTGSGIAGKMTDDNAQAYTAMGRGDIGPVSFSLRHWGNKTAWLEHSAVSAEGETLVFRPDPTLLDEKTDHLIFGGRYADPMFVVDLVLDRATYNLTAPRNIMDGETVLHTFEQSPLNRTGMSLSLTVIFNQWMEGGVAASVINAEKYTRTVDGVAEEVAATSTAIGQIRFTFSPAINTRLALEAQLDLTGADGRIGADGKQYPAQNRLIAQWQLAL